MAGCCWHGAKALPQRHASRLQTYACANVCSSGVDLIYFSDQWVEYPNGKSANGTLGPWEALPMMNNKGEFIARMGIMCSNLVNIYKHSKIIYKHTVKKKSTSTQKASTNTQKASTSTQKVSTSTQK